LGSLLSISNILTEYENRIKALESGGGKTEGETEPSAGWELSYTYSGNPNINAKIKLEDFTGWDGSQTVTNAIYDDYAAGFEMWANNPTALGTGYEEFFNIDTADRIPFNGNDGKNPVASGTITEWGYDYKTGEFGAITITGSSGGFDIPIKLIKIG